MGSNELPPTNELGRGDLTSPTPRDSDPLRILVIFAHPDDESFGPAALLAKYALEGARIDGLFYTRGQFGDTFLDPKPPPAELGLLRESDLRAAAKLIGFNQVDVLDYIDGTLNQIPMEQLTTDALAAIQRYRPNFVLTFGPAGITHHPDHIAVYQAATLAFGQALRANTGVRGLFYSAVMPADAKELNIEGEPDAQPNTFIGVAGTEDIQVEALRIHGQHIVDAREEVARQPGEQRPVAPLHRAWPPVPPGIYLAGLRESDARPCPDLPLPSEDAAADKVRLV